MVWAREINSAICCLYRAHLLYQFSAHTVSLRYSVRSSCFSKPTYMATTTQF
ncbi:hypothetical protein KC19_VG113500 [Ceratodon purpureus]|uniref:Uncharacterized protein n=1 Tax=Ceratodon purpureus TaxID=3225 RepID=A0A8T0HPD6_CERPU|nr:hypothetical protein KC19_VG113500 [Ceratodon purpureus]